MSPSVTLAGLVLLTVLIGLVWRSRQGSVRAPRPTADAVDWLARLRESGVEPGSRGTFVQLSAEVCAPCRATARVLAAAAGAAPGVVHAELDVEAHPGLVRAAKVLRTPTVVMIDGEGAEVARSSGAMNSAQAQAALAALGAGATTQDPTTDATTDPTTDRTRGRTA